MIVVSLAHGAQLVYVGVECRAIPGRHMVAIEHMLNGCDGAVQFALIEAPAIPLAREIAQLLFGIVQTAAIAPCEHPSALIRTVEVGVHAIDGRRNRIRRISIVGTVAAGRGRRLAILRERPGRE